MSNERRIVSVVFLDVELNIVVGTLERAAEGADSQVSHNANDFEVDDVVMV